SGHSQTIGAPFINRPAKPAERSICMRTSRQILIVLSIVLGLPLAAHAQASIAGVVKDASGAVLPGVTVEATSPVLIERARTAVTDETGQYRIVDLRAGTYT